MRARVGVAVLAAALASAGSAAVAAPGVRLVYARGDGAADCPDEEVLRAGVVSQLGRNPFSDEEPAALTVTALLARSGGRIYGRVEVVDEHGRPEGARQLDGASCDELVPALELVIAMAVEPWMHAQPAPPPAPPAPAVVRPRRLDGLRARFGAGVLVALDASPAAAALGFTLQFELAAPRWSVGAELRGDLPTSAPSLFGGRVETALVAGFVVPCVRHRLVVACALAGFGLERGSGSGYDGPTVVSAFWAALGARLALELKLFSPVGLRLHVDVLAPLTRTELYVGPAGGSSRLLYRTAAMSSVFGIALMFP
jgi:hypothetical protein